MEKQELQDALAEGFSLREIAVLFGFASSGPVSYWLRKYNLSVPSRTANSISNLKYSDLQLTEAVANSLSILGVTRYIGCSECSSMQGHLSRRVRELGLDTSHFIRGGGVRPTNRRTAESILVKLPSGSQRTPGALLRRALDEQGVKYVCVECGNLGEWFGRPLKLEVDHIDGDWLNNLITNLRYLCPNCHSQQETGNSYLPAQNSSSG